MNSFFDQIFCALVNKFENFIRVILTFFENLSQLSWTTKFFPFLILYTKLLDIFFIQIFDCWLISQLEWSLANWSHIFDEFFIVKLKALFYSVVPAMNEFIFLNKITVLLILDNDDDFRVDIAQYFFNIGLKLFINCLDFWYVSEFHVEKLYLYMHSISIFYFLRFITDSFLYLGNQIRHFFSQVGA